ncbi:hypothetical protein BY458DRAFT_529618 [Sporodiniella umbellata]|nr:hypothetical protein BY458DRAFT_529618 [Sporodiniella umbellata]
MILDLPPEVLLRITFFLTCRELSCLRYVCRQLQIYCDAPSNWKCVDLRPLKRLWQLNELRELIGPHRRDIRTIRIEGVRDNVVQYILNHCLGLKHLVVYGRLTLSDHSLRLSPNQSLGLRSIQFIGTANSTLLVDASTLARFIKQAPELDSLVFGCQAHVHADTFIAELEKIKKSRSPLRSVTLATKQTWNKGHIARFVDLYPTLEHVQLTPEAAKGFEDLDSFRRWFKQRNPQKTDRSLVSSQDLIMYNRMYT